MAKRGQFMVLEGFEGAGKTSRAAALQERISRETERRCEIVREPGGDPFAEQLRGLLKGSPDEITPWAEVFTFCAARANLLALKVKPLMADGVVVISDRNYLSTVAYQGWGNDWPADELERLRQVCKTAARPAPSDLTLLLNLAYDTAMQRVVARDEGGDRFERRDAAYHHRVIAGYREEARLAGYPIIDANQAPEQVDVAIWEQVQPLITPQ